MRLLRSRASVLPGKRDGRHGSDASSGILSKAEVQREIAGHKLHRLGGHLHRTIRRRLRPNHWNARLQRRASWSVEN